MQCEISFVFLSAPLSLYLTLIFAWFRVSGLQSVTVLILYIALLSRLRMPLCLHWPNSGEQTLFDSPSQVWSGLLTCCCCWLWLLDSILSHIIVYAIVSFADMPFLLLSDVKSPGDPKYTEAFGESLYMAEQIFL
jgi:hypothetical protein